MVNYANKFTTWIIRESISHAILFLNRYNDKLTLSKSEMLLTNLLEQIVQKCHISYDSTRNQFSRIDSIEILGLGDKQFSSIKELIKDHNIHYPDELRIMTTSEPIDYSTGMEYVLECLGSVDVITNIRPEELDAQAVSAAAIINIFIHIIFDWMVLCSESIVDEVSDDIGIIFPLSLMLQEWCFSIPYYRLGKYHDKSISKYKFRIFYGLYIDHTIMDRMIPVRMVVDEIRILNR